MKLFIFIALAVMLVGMTAQAAEVPTSAGDKAMVFMFNGLDDLSLGTYGEYGFGVRYYIADGMAVRAGLTVGMDSRTDESNVAGAADAESKDTDYGLNVALEMHMESPCSSVSPYYGIGADIMMSSEEDITAVGTTGDTRTVTVSETAFGGFGIVGFEWAFANCMTLGGEYQLGLQSSSGETETENGTTVTSNKFSTSLIGFQTCSVYLSVYF